MSQKTTKPSHFKISKKKYAEEWGAGTLDQRGVRPAGMLDQRGVRPMGTLDQRIRYTNGVLDQRVR